MRLIARIMFARELEEMVSLLVARGIRDADVLEAMRTVPRHLFVPERERGRAYADRPLPIGFDQTISQPYIVALTLEALELHGDERVLEVGTGSAYQAALLGLLAGEVYSVEVIADLAQHAAWLLDRLGLENVVAIRGDGGIGLEAHAPYHAIAVAAACPSVPEPLFAQLADGGRMVLPIGDAERQELVRVRKVHDRPESETLARCRFVPLVGREGFYLRGQPW